MVDFVGLMSGFNEREKENVASRKDMAKAFADFKAANPYASAAEFQSFIDSYSGGRNYIAGGAPGSEIITALGQANTEKQARDILRQQIDDASQRNTFRDNLRTSAEGFLLDLEDENPDFAAAYDQFIEEMGVDPVFGKQIFGEQKLTSIFNQQNVNRLRLDEMNKNMPAFLDYLKSTGGDVSEADFAAAATKYNIPQFMVKDARKIFKEQTDNDRIALESDRKEELLNLAIAAIERGDPDIASVITGRAKTLKFNTDAPEFKAYVESISNQAELEANTQLAKKQNAQLGALVAFVNEQIRLGNDQLLDINLKEMARTLQINPDAPAFEEYKKRVLANAKLVRDREAEDRTRAQNTEDAAAANTFRTTLKGDADLDALIRRGMLNEARAEIDDMVSRYADPNIKALMKDVGDQFIQSRIAFQQDVQDDILRERYDAAQVANADVGINFKTANVEAATNHFTAFAGSGKTNPNAGPHAGNAAMAAQDLALEFQMTPSTLAIITDVFKSIEEPASRQQLTQAARQQLQGIALPFAQAQSAAVNSAMVKSRGGSYAQDTTVANWRQTTSERVDSHTTGISEGIERIRQSNRPPADKVMMLEALNREMQQGYAYINTAIRDSITESTGENTWVTYGTPMLDAQAEYFGPNGLRPRIEQSMKTLTADIKRMSEQEAEKAAAAAKAQPSTSSSSITSDATTVAGREADIEQQTNARRNTVDEFRDNARNKINVIGRNLTNQSDAEYQDNLALAAFLGNAHGGLNDPLTFPIISGSLTGYDDSGPAGVMDDIIGDDDAFSRFKLDPVGFMKSYELPNGTNWYEGWLERNQ